MKKSVCLIYFIFSFGMIRYMVPMRLFNHHNSPFFFLIIFLIISLYMCIDVFMRPCLSILLFLCSSLIYKSRTGQLIQEA